MINNILFPTDYSENAKNALPFAIDLAKKNDAKLMLIHIYETPLVPPSSIFRTRKQTMIYTDNLIITAAKKNMRDLIKGSEMKDVPHSYAILEGNTQEEIEKVIANSAIDLVVMGTLGETAKRELFMGSVTKNLIQKIHCPVLAVPKDCVFGNFKEIVYATDLKDDETEAIAYLVQISDLYNATLTILHLDLEQKDKTKHIIELKELVAKSSYPNLKYEEIIVEDILTGLELYVQQHESSMLAMTTKTAGFFDKIFHKSLTKEILFHSHIPIFTFNSKSKSLVY